MSCRWVGSGGVLEVTGTEAPVLKQQGYVYNMIAMAWSCCTRQLATQLALAGRWHQNTDMAGVTRHSIARLTKQAMGDPQV